MRNPILYLIIIVVCILSSCNMQQRGSGALPKELVQAENIMYENPDSALHILQAMPIPTEKEAHATWALFLTQAKYKCNVEQTDSLLNIAHNYFMKGENTQRKALTLFCKAGLYEEQENIESATYSYLDAVKVSDEINDYRLRHLINVRLALLYVRRNLYDYAIEYCEKANQYALLSRDSFYITNSYNNLGRVYSAKKEYEKAISFYDKAIELGKAYDETKALNFALQEKAGIYILQNKFNEALSLMKMIKPSNMSFASFQILGHLYSKINQPDSAYYYLDKALMVDDIYVLRSAYRVLFNMSKKQKDYKRNAEYSVKLWKINDSISNIDRSKSLIEMQEKYDEQKVINEKNKAEQRGLIVLCVSISMIGIIVIYYQWRVLLQKRELENKRDELVKLQNKLNENNNKIDKNKERLEMVANVGPEDITEELLEKEVAIQNMQQQNESLKKENEMLQDKIKEHINVLQEKSKDSERLSNLINRNTYLRKRENYLSNQLLKMDEMITSLKKEPNSLEEYQWRELMEKTDTLFDGYTERLLKVVPSLTTHDIHICCLIKLSFSHIAIADILSISPTSLSRQKQRMKERIIQQIGSLGENVLLDIWLKEF